MLFTGLYMGSQQAETCRSSSLQYGHSEAKPACVRSSSRYANCKQNNKQGFPVVLTGWKAVVPFGQEPGGELRSALLGEGGGPQLVGARSPCKGRSEVASVKGNGPSV